MEYTFQPMTLSYAAQICQWQYEEPYSLYSLEESEECIVEFMNGDYYAVLNQGKQIVGFICTGYSARVGGGYPVGIYDNSTYLDIGLGLRPDMTGKGHGLQFMTQMISFIKKQHPNRELQLVVASYNERAIRVYERAGFRKETTFRSSVGDQDLEFTLMQHETSFNVQ